MAKAIFVLVLVVCSWACGSENTAGPAIESAQGSLNVTTPPANTLPTAQWLLNDLHLPYIGVGRFGVTNDGVLLLDVRGNIGPLAIPVNREGVEVVTRQGRTTLECAGTHGRTSDSDQASEIRQTFDNCPHPEWGSYFLAEVTGELSLDYDAEETGRLDFHATDRSGNTFEAVFIVRRGGEDVTKRVCPECAIPNCPPGKECAYCKAHGCECWVVCNEDEYADCKCSSTECRGRCVSKKEVVLEVVSIPES